MHPQLRRALIALAALAAGYVTTVVLAIAVQVATIVSTFGHASGLKGNSTPAVVATYPPALLYAATALCAVGWYLLFIRLARPRKTRPRL